jgi:hypothetical protein
MREFFDDGFPRGEQIPRHMEVVLTAEPGPFGEVVRMTVNGVRAASVVASRVVVQLSPGKPVADLSWVVSLMAAADHGILPGSSSPNHP